MVSRLPLFVTFVFFSVSVSVCVAANPSVETLLKTKSLIKIREDMDIVTNADWANDVDFEFTTAGIIRVPMSFARPYLVNFQNYAKVSSNIKKLDFQEQKQELALEGEAGGYAMKSTFKVDTKAFDHMSMEVIKGHLLGFKVQTYLYESGGKTLLVSKGFLPRGKKFLPSAVVLIFKPVSEMIIGIATRNFRSHIEKEYTNQKQLYQGKAI